MNWKELKTNEYKGFTYIIYGRYTEEYPTRIDGEEKYKESIETKVKIIDSSNTRHENDWYNMRVNNYEDFTLQYLIRFRAVYKKGWFYDLFPKVIDVIHIKDDYTRVIDDWSKYCKKVIDGMLSREEKKEINNVMTDGLPDSVFIRYQDR